MSPQHPSRPWSSRLATLTVLVTLAALAGASPASAVYAENFGIVPGSFFAGTCDLPAVTGSEPMTASGAPPLETSAWPEAVEKRDCHSSSPLVPQTAQAVTAAGAHPDATTTFEFNPIDEPGKVGPFPDGNPQDLALDLPVGFAGNPQAAPRCSGDLFVEWGCPVETQVGVVELRLSTGTDGNLFNNPSCPIGQPNANTMFPPVYPQFSFPEGAASHFAENGVASATQGPGSRCRVPLYNLEPPYGELASFGFNYASAFVVVARPVLKEGEYAIQVQSLNIPESPAVSKVTATLWGVPGDPAHDAFRFRSILMGGGSSHPSIAPGQPWPADVPVKPFLANPTECAPDAPVTKLTVNSWQNREEKLTYEDAAEPVTDCADAPFDPDISIQPDSTEPDSPTGLDAELDLPQPGWEDPDVTATAHLKDTVVSLPEGLAVNPSAATGLKGCSDVQIGMVASGSPPAFDHSDPFDGQGADCPNGSKIGTVTATTPLLAETLTGDVVLGTPKSVDPESGEMLRLFLVLRSEERGLVVKVHGTSVADPATGRLTATFANNPRLPVEHVALKLKGGARGVLATPQTCGARSIATRLTPWTAAHGGGGPVRDLVDGFTVGGDCSLGFAPKLVAGSSSRQARGTGDFTFRFTREDGEQWIEGLTADLPAGLLASVKDLPLCASAQADAGACPAGSRIGTVDATAGSGTTPFKLERKGAAYLTEGYKGCAYGLAVVVPMVAGPFDGTSPATDLGDVVVRQRICVDPSDAHVSVVSDPLPTIWHGIPLRVRSVTVAVDRDGFMLNPSDCSGKQVGAGFGSDRGTAAKASAPFSVAGCAGLRFKPSLTMAVAGRRQMKTGRHPRIRVAVTQPAGQAGIERAEVRLPSALALDPDNAQALCEYEDGIKADPESHCPAGSVVGRARAVSPLLNRPLRGDVYFVKNVRMDPKTGARIRTLPMLVVALRGEIAVNLKGTSTVKGSRLVSTFADLPDAPISQFNLNVRGGARGILVVTDSARGPLNLCSKRRFAQVQTDGHNGRQADYRVRVKTPCRRPGRPKR
jgi:hypothetical protein